MSPCRVKTINLSLGKIAHDGLKSRMNTCHHGVIPEVRFAVNTWLIKINQKTNYLFC